MANITLTIPLPILTGSQYFKTRYRLLPAGAWSSNVNRTNAHFTITGLTAGSYQLEAILVNSDNSECPATYIPFTVVEDFDCIDFDTTLVQSGSLYRLDITYTLPGGFTNPACGWDIIVTDATGTKTIPYSTLPVSGTISVAVSNIAMLVRVRANLCNGDYKYCHEEDVSPIAPSCTPMVVTKADMVKASGVYYVRVFLFNSTPATATLNFNYKEISNQFPVGAIPDSGTFSYSGPPLLPGNNYMFSFQVQPKAYPGEGLIYEGTVTDVCGKSHYWKTAVFFG